MSKFGVSRLDLMAGHAYHYEVEENIENGLLVEIDFATGKVTPTTDIKKDQHLISSVANLYDSVDESDFINTPEGAKARVFTFNNGDIFTTTQFTGTPKKGDHAYATVGGKFTISGTEEATAAQGFRVVGTDVLLGQDAVVLQVVKA